MGVVTRSARTAPLWLLSLGLLAPGCFDPLPPDDAAATPRDVAAEAVDTPEPIDLPTFDIPPLDRPATDVAPDRGPADVAPEAARPDTGADTGTDTGADTGTDTGAGLDASAMMPDADAGDVPVDLPDAGFDIPTVDVPIVTRTELLGPSRGSAVAVTADDRIVVSANRVSGSASVFAMVPGSFGVLARINELALGAGSEPVSVVMAPDNNAAYVLLRVSQRVVRIDRLRSGGELFATRAVVGSEPTSMALSPSGRTLYVTNWGDGTVTVVDTESMRAAVDLELNEALARGGFLGAGAVARRGLAHPRAVVITNDRDGDDDDEVAWVTEYFAQGRTTPGPTGNERFDQSHVGVVYRIPLFTREASAHTLEPAASMGFRDASNVTAGCYPNQLSAIALAAGRVYVAGTCTSPRGPIGDGVVPTPGDAGVPTDAGPTDAGPRDGGATDAGPPAVPALPVQRQNLRTLHTPALWVLDGMTGSEIAAQRVLLNSRWLSLYDARRTPDTDARRYPLTPVDLAFVPGTDGNTTASTVAWVLAYGADAMFRVRFNTNGTVAEVGATGAAFVDLDTAPAAGRGPYGMALGGAASNNAVVVHERTRNVSLVRLDTQTVIAGAAVTDTALSTADNQIADGRWAFHTGRGRWSLNGQAWSACGSCHPDGLSDNVTWYTARGPRQTIPLDSALNAAGLPRIFGWTAQADEVSDMETEARSTQGGRRRRRASPSQRAHAAAGERRRPHRLRRHRRGVAAARDARPAQRAQRYDGRHRQRDGHPHAAQRAQRLGGDHGVCALDSYAAASDGARGDGCHRGAGALRHGALRGLPRRRSVYALAALLHARRGGDAPEHGHPRDAELDAAGRLSDGGAAPRVGALPDGRARPGQRPDYLRAPQRGHLGRGGGRDRAGGDPRGGAHQHDDGVAGGQRLQHPVVVGRGALGAVLPRGQRAHSGGGPGPHV